MFFIYRSSFLNVVNATSLYHWTIPTTLFKKANLKSLYIGTRERFLEWRIVVREKILKMSSIYFCSFATVSPCERCGLLMTKFEPSSVKNASCQILFDLFLWFWRRHFFYLLIVYSLFCYYSRLENGMSLHIIRKAELSFSAKLN